MDNGARRQRFGKFVQDKAFPSPRDLNQSRVIEHLRLGIVIASSTKKRRDRMKKSVSRILSG